MEAATKWSYYISSYALRDPTEGVPGDKLRFPFLRRNLPTPSATEDELNNLYLPQFNEDGLIMRIKPETYEICFRDPGTSDWFLHDLVVEKRGTSGMEEVKRERKARFGEKWGLNSPWIKGMTRTEVNTTNEKFRKWVDEGPEAGKEEAMKTTNTTGNEADDEAMMEL